jgi:hypothetical protein
MRAVLVVLLAAVSLAAKDPPPVRPQPVDTYAAKESHDGVTIAAEPYNTEEKSKAVFGKCDPLPAPTNVMPVYLVIGNSTKDTLRLEKWTVEFIAADRQKAEPIPAGTVSLMIRGKKLPEGLGQPRVSFPGLSKGCDVKAADILVAREFLLKMVPPGDTVGGFLFFDTAKRNEVLRGAKLYLTGMKWGSSGKELFYFEINFDDYLKSK